MIGVKNLQARGRLLQGCIQLKLESFRERSGDSLSPCGGLDLLGLHPRSRSGSVFGATVKPDFK